MEQIPLCKECFYQQHCYVANIVKAAQCNHYKQIILEHTHDYKTIFSIANRLLFRKQESLLPLISLISELAEGFIEFFQTKIDNIIVKLHVKASEVDNRYIKSRFETDHRMYNFTPVFHSNVKEIIYSAPAKSCELDPIPTSLLKVHIGVLAPLITNIANSSFEAGIFSDALKDALLHPLHKHPSFKLLFGNFRLVSNLSYFGKLIEI